MSRLKRPINLILGLIDDSAPYNLHFVFSNFRDQFLIIIFNFITPCLKSYFETHLYKLTRHRVINCKF